MTLWLHPCSTDLYLCPCPRFPNLFPAHAFQSFGGVFVDFWVGFPGTCRVNGTCLCSIKNAWSLFFSHTTVKAYTATGGVSLQLKI